MPRITFITGPAYSGKSEVIHNRLSHVDDVLYIACALYPHPSELFNRRVQKLKSMRNKNWTTAEILKNENTLHKIKLSNKYSTVVLDSLSLWLGYQINLGIKKFNIEELYDHILKESQYLWKDLTTIAKDIFILSTEVGFCPPGSHELENLYRMLLADINKDYSNSSDSTEIIILGKSEAIFKKSAS